MTVRKDFTTFFTEHFSVGLWTARFCGDTDEAAGAVHVITMTENLGVCPDGVDAPPPILCGQLDERVPLVEQIRAHNMILDLNCVGGGEFLQCAGKATSPHVDREICQAWILDFG